MVIVSKQQRQMNSLAVLKWSNTTYANAASVLLHLHNSTCWQGQGEWRHARRLGAVFARHSTATRPPLARRFYCAFCQRSVELCFEVLNLLSLSCYCVYFRVKTFIPAIGHRRSLHSIVMQRWENSLGDARNKGFAFNGGSLTFFIPIINKFHETALNSQMSIKPTTN